MRRRPVARHTILGLGLALGLTIEALAVGLGIGPVIGTIDVAGTVAKVPAAATAAFDALDGAFASLGLPQVDRDAIRAEFEQSLVEIEQSLALFPTVLPMPLVGGSFELPLPLFLVDGVRISGGFLTDGLVRGVADLLGLTIPSPLVDIALDEGELDGSIEANLAFRSWQMATELYTRFDVLVAALELAVGIQWASWDATPIVQIDVPPELADGADAALDALHLDGFNASAFAIHAGVGIELGPPFLRLSFRGRIALPISASSGWWALGIGDFGGAIEVVIRF